jgi:PKHD-type hydroxylase
MHSQNDPNKSSFIPNLINYYYFDKVFDKEKLDKLEEQLKGLSPEEMIEGNTAEVVNKSYRNSRIHWIPKTEEWKWLYEYMGQLAKHANDQIWHFDITHMNEMIQYTEYDEEYEGHYDWHVDVGAAETSKRKISISVQLSGPEDYEGGDLQFYIKRDLITAPKTRGTATLFPSYFLHRVRPVTKGRRRCLILWISGPPFK